jgi:hypothetical protein
MHVRPLFHTINIGRLMSDTALSIPYIHIWLSTSFRERWPMISCAFKLMLDAVVRIV